MVSFIEQPATQSLQKSNSAPSTRLETAGTPFDDRSRSESHSRLTASTGSPAFAIGSPDRGVGLQCPLVVPYDPLP